MGIGAISKRKNARNTQFLRIMSFKHLHHNAIICLTILNLIININAYNFRNNSLLNFNLNSPYSTHNRSAIVSLKSNVIKEDSINSSLISPSLEFLRFNEQYIKAYKYSDSLTFKLSFKNFRKEYNGLDSLDFLSRITSLNFCYNNSYSKFSTNNKLYYGINNHSSSSIKQISQKDYSSNINPDNLSDELKDILAGNWEERSGFSASYSLSLTPHIGFGKIIDKSRILKTLYIERLLIKREVIKFSLSDKSIKEIANLIGLYTNTKLRNKEQLEEFRNKLNTIVSSDAAADKEMLRYISPLDLKKILLVRYKQLSKGNTLYISSASNFFANGKNIDVSYPYDLSNTYKSYKEKLSNVDFRQDLVLNGILNTSIGKSIFLKLSAQRIVLSTDISPDFKDSKGDIKWTNVLDVRWQGECNLLIHPSFYLSSGIENLRSYLIVPNNPPNNIFNSIHLNIENYLEIITTLRYHFNLENDPYHYLYNNSKTDFPEERKLVFTLFLCYNF